MQIPSLNPQTTDQLAWTALPNGVGPGGDSLKLSVLLSPRVLNPAILPRGFQNWPQSLKNHADRAKKEDRTAQPLRFDVDFFDAAGNRLAPYSKTVDAPTDNLQPDLWSALFDDLPSAALLAEAAAPPLHHAVTRYQNRDLTTFNVRANAESIRKKYAGILAQSRVAAQRHELFIAANANIAGSNAGSLFLATGASPADLARQAKAQHTLNTVAADYSHQDVQARVARNTLRLNLSASRKLKAEAIFALLRLCGAGSDILSQAGYVQSDEPETALCVSLLQLLLFHRKPHFPFYLARNPDPGQLYHSRIATSASSAIGAAAVSVGTGVSAARQEGIVTFTFAAPHGLQPGASITGSGFSTPTFNTKFTINYLPTASTVTCSQPSAPDETANGGTITLNADYPGELLALETFRKTLLLKGEVMVALMVRNRVAANVLQSAGGSLYPSALIDRYVNLLAVFFTSVRILTGLAAAGKLVDFNQRATLLHGHPLVQRALGLVFDLDVPMSDLAGLAARGVTVRVTPHSPLTGYTNKLPSTTFDLLNPATSGHASWRFWAKATRIVGDGMLKIQATNPNLTPDPNDPDSIRQFYLEGLDVDGAAEKNSRHNANKDRAKAHPAPDQGNTTSADPSLRSAGISLIMNQRKEAFEAKIQNPPSPHLETPKVLNAEDVLLGYRADVWESKTASWHALCKRDGRYIFPGARKNLEAKTAAEKGWIEGIVQLGNTVPSDGTQDVRVHEALLRWDNWSLSVKFEDEVTINQAPPPDDPDAIQSLNVEVSFEVPDATLPPLRFGVGYYMRCRAVDLAGNSLAFEDCDDVDSANKLGVWVHSGGNATPAPFVYRRYEPLTAPLLLLWGPRGHLTPGEQMNRLVVRNGSKTDDARRVVVPPRVAQSYAELHGVFDTSLDLPDGAFPFVHLNDDASFPMMDGTPDSTKQPDLTNAYFSRSSTANPDPPPIRYFPDPYVRMARMDIKDRFGNTVGGPQIVPFYGDEPGNAWPSKLKRNIKPEQWPQAREFFVEVVPGEPEERIRYEALSSDWIGVDDGRHRQRVPKLTIHVPPGEQATVTISAHFGNGPAADERLRSMALYPLVVSAAPPLAGPDQVFHNHVIAGMNSLFTPSHSFTLVHALEQPRDTPEWQSPLADRVAAGDTSATLTGTLVTHGQSTAKLDLNAVWEEPVDEPKADLATSPGPRRIKGSFTLEQKLNPDSQSSDQTLWTSAKPAKHEFHDTKFRRVEYQLVATSSYREYFPKSGNLVRAGLRIPKNIRSSARPAAPAVLYAVPAFAWNRKPGKHDFQSTRGGGILRVYMSRGWYSSGDDERLAAILWPNVPRPSDSSLIQGAAPPPLPISLQALVTQWGSDPLWVTADVAHFPAYQDFRNAVDYEFDLSLKELDAQNDAPKVAAVAFQPEFDSKRMLWYCDIDLGKQTSYFPFIRLALARFQHNSISKDLMLSPVVLSDFMQLTPTRVATVQKIDKHSVRLTIRGVTAKNSYVGQHASVRPRSVMCVTVEQQASGYSDGLPTGWLLAEGFTAMEIAAQGDGDDVVWTAVIPLPKFDLFRPRRILVREIERYLADKPDDRSSTVVAPRVVYVDVLPIVK